MRKSDRHMPFGLAIIPFIAMIIAMGFTIVVFKGSAHVPLILGAIVSALIAWSVGFNWVEIESSIYKGIRLSLPAIVIIILVGILIGAWIGGGIVATMFYYGLKLISPAFFLVSIAVICAIVSIATGSSWSTMGTIGIAGMGIGTSMGIPASMVAGAIISGAYFGDKMSPLSDTTNLASGTVGANLFEHIKHMTYTTVPAFIIALGVYWYLGTEFGSNKIDFEKIQSIMIVLQENFVISPWLLVVPAVVIVLVSQKVPVMPSLIAGIILGFLADIFVQGGSVGTAIHTLQSGFVIETGNATIDELFNRGGIDDMMYTVSLVICAMTFGGILENTGMLNAIVTKIIKVARTARGLLTTTVMSAFATNVLTAEQYISVVLPGRMYVKRYRELNLHPKNLSRAIEDGGTLTSVFVPWNTCAVFIFGTLGVSVFEYAPYAILNYLVPILSIIFAWTGLTIAYMTKEERTKWKEVEEKAEDVV
ncbi:Na+/H+ antiporter NhaC [Bacillus sp. NTK071]|uniref:Na+/H+ antiporter NhaC n=1 Tax=Bacillus sp. NTK071 TaxID=2802175 RepID=UPI001A90923F|nr:Na+/H+ antiporter NhaC [Bacillus sp. NTK071]MBN8210193.1 Na+/H+ antiporter NhaC [Bacillus sp. NTK071]